MNVRPAIGNGSFMSSEIRMGTGARESCNMFTNLNYRGTSTVGLCDWAEDKESRNRVSSQPWRMRSRGHFDTAIHRTGVSGSFKTTLIAVNIAKLPCPRVPTLYCNRSLCLRLFLLLFMGFRRLRVSNIKRGWIVSFLPNKFSHPHHRFRSKENEKCSGKNWNRSKTSAIEWRGCALLAPARRRIVCPEGKSTPPP